MVASLALHYVRDWGRGAGGEFRRVLTPAGAVVFSTHHPTMDWPEHSPEDYFAIRQITETWETESGEFDVTFWRRPLTAMTRGHRGGRIRDRAAHRSPKTPRPAWPSWTRAPTG